MSIMMGLGQFRFSLNTSAYRQLRRSIEYRWQGQDRLQNDVAMQFLGTGKEEIEFEGIIYPQFRGGLDQIRDMQEAAKKGEPLLLIDGLGQIWDRWVITRIEETQEVFLKAGVPRKISFRMAITRYGEDQ